MKIGIVVLLIALSPVMTEAVTLSGFVTDQENGESLPYCSVVLKGEGPPLGTITNLEGYFAIKRVPGGTYALMVSYVGYDSHRDTLDLSGTGERRLDVALVSAPIVGAEIVVEADPYEEERAVQTGFIALETEQLQAPPSVAEPDILRSLQLLPGIQAASDISSGLYIRGGGPDQTLILLDQIPLYNPSHAFGFFSTFNSDAIKDIALHKGAYPANYGGRLGSVLDVHNRDGNRKAFQGTGGVSLISGRLTLEGPMPRGSWMLSGRRTYLEPMLSAIRNDSTEVPSYFFYDFNAKLNQDWGDKDKVSTSGYFGRDDLDFDLDEGSYISIRWGNTALTGKWTHLFSPALFGSFMVAGSKYTSETSLSFFETPIRFSNSIRDITAKGDIDYFATSHHSLTAGFLGSWYEFSFEQTFNYEDQLDLKEKPTLLSFYIQDHWQPGLGTSIRLGGRVNSFSEGGRLHWEPRFSLSREVRPKLRFKLGGGSYHQYLQLVTTEGFSGGDFWVPIDDTVEPGRSWQGVAGLQWEPSKRYEASIEAYYVDLENLVVLDTKVAVDSEETTSEDVFVTGGKGHSTGLELFLQRRTGALTGWIGYTLGWTRRTFPELNGGKAFPPKYDRRHDLSFVANYRMGRWTLGANLLFGTGQAFTPAAARYTMRSPATGVFLDDDFVLPADKNSARLLPYHRLDLSVNRRVSPWGLDAEIYLQVFNVYNRRNEWFVQYDADNPYTDPNVIKMLPVLPTLGINFSF